MSVAIGNTSKHVFVLHENKVYPVDVKAGTVDLDSPVSVKENTAWIYVTSPKFADADVVDESEDKGDEIQNPEDMN